jgi:HSP20 family protein
MHEMLRWDPFRDTSMLGAWEQGRFIPRFDIKETNEGFLIRADLPGIEEKDLKVTLTGNRLTVAGTREQETTKEHEQLHMVERSYGSFTRAFALPEGVDASKVHAELKNGVLTLMLPRKPDVKPKEIAVKVK